MTLATSTHSPISKFLQKALANCFHLRLGLFALPQSVEHETDLNFRTEMRTCTRNAEMCQATETTEFYWLEFELTFALPVNNFAGLAKLLLRLVIADIRIWSWLRCSWWTSVSGRRKDGLI